MTKPTRPHDALWWASIAGMGLVAVLPWVTALRARGVAVLRALMPWATVPALPLALITRRLDRPRLALAAGAVFAAGVAPSVRVLVPRQQTRPAPGSASLSIVHANLLFDNIWIGEVASALEPLGADVLTFSEYTPHHARVLRASGLADAYPHRLEAPAALASGTALWSRHPVRPGPMPATRHHTVIGDVDVGGDPIRVVVIHTQSPVLHHRQWCEDLDVLSRVVAEQPAVMVGDFNAAWWHPEFRRVLRAGWRDVHQVVGRGLSPSWPVDHNLVPPFIRLDHALVNSRVVVDEVGDFTIPGSDHRGLVVTVVPAG